MKLVVLYEELSGYFISCIGRFSEKYSVEVHVFRKEVNSEAPFEFKTVKNIFFYNRTGFSDNELQSLILKIDPGVMFCGGWIYKPYLNICKKYRNKIPVIIAFDNTWKNSLKQNIASLISSFTIHKYFNVSWVAGQRQYEYAKRLGFRNDRIFLHVYSADYDHFNNWYIGCKEQKRKNFPHRFIFIGRYYEFKGIKDLWSAFIEAETENPNNWELWCLGTGNIEPIVHPKIKHFGFIQPDEMKKFIQECGVFILPSTFEPWGVAVHEFSSAGFTLICSDEVGAVEMFLKNEENGFVFKSGNTADLKRVLNKVMSTTDEKLFKMGERSAELAGQITPDKWADTLWSIINRM